jgi:hypothetical protein
MTEAAKAPYFLVAELAPLTAKRGKGAIVNLSTMVADYGAVGMSLYGSSAKRRSICWRPTPFCGDPGRLLRRFAR